jgi:predicted enzyme related to lactoylglutathione lyase
VVGWFEIPVTDMQLAVKFYNTVFGLTLGLQELDGIEMAWFLWSDSGMEAHGSLVQQEESYKPSADGILIYFISPSGNLTLNWLR